MKYYICLEEDRIWYVRGRFKRCPGSGSHRRLEIVEWEIVERVWLKNTAWKESG